jgi:hypothetical protein
VSRFPPITVRFEYGEAQLLVEALRAYQPPAATDRLKVVRMRELFETELEGGLRR